MPPVEPILDLPNTFDCISQIRIAAQNNKRSVCFLVCYQSFVETTDARVRVVYREFF